MTDAPQDPKDAPMTAADDEPTDARQPGRHRPLSADEGEPDVEPFAGDDDIRSGHLGPTAQQ